jgi:hypothetical protein
VLSIVVRRPPVLADRNPLAFGLVDKEGRRVESRQSLEELLVAWREPIVRLVSGATIQFDAGQLRV